MKLVNSIPAIHRLLPLSLTFDHRAVSGGEAEDSSLPPFQIWRYRIEGLTTPIAV